MNRQCELHVFKREEVPVHRGRCPIYRLWATHVNKGKQYPYMPAHVRAAMIRSEVEKQARGNSG